MSQPVPPRLYVILAREAPKAVVIRRGPTDWFRLSLWHTGSDVFEHGQWFKGKVFFYRSDLSPDGSLFLYFASKYTGLSRRSALGYSDTYTAISKPPYFTALALWPTVSGTWMGGGLFIKKRTIWFNNYPGHTIKHHPNHKPHRLKVIPNRRLWPGDMPVYARRLDRDGWILQPEGSFSEKQWHSNVDFSWNTRLTWHKLHQDGDFHLILEGHQNVFTYALFDNNQKTETLLDNFTWADWGHTGRLIGARDGQIIVMNPEAPNEDVVVLDDFNDQTPDPQPSPEWARKW